jgi:hypothetical protein
MLIALFKLFGKRLKFRRPGGKCDIALCHSLVTRAQDRQSDSQMQQYFHYPNPLAVADNRIESIRFNR